MTVLKLGRNYVGKEAPLGAFMLRLCFSCMANSKYRVGWRQNIEHIDTQHNDTQGSDTQRSDTQRSETQRSDTQHNNKKYCYAECH